jgi:hypothetical protein
LQQRDVEAKSLHLNESRWPSALRSLLGHPLVLLLVGALLTSILVPSCTRDWQHYEKELEIKRELVRDVSETTGTFLQALSTAQVRSGSAARFPRVGPPDYAGKLVDRWKVDGEVLGSEIQLYFPESELNDRWLRFVTATNESYDLFTLGLDRQGRQFALTRIGKALRLTKDVRGELRILARPPEEISALFGGVESLELNYIKAGFRLIELIEAERAQILEELLRSPTAL